MVNEMIKRIKLCGFLATIYYYYKRIGNFLYVLSAFGRSDLNIPYDSRIIGIKNISFGKGVVAGRGLWIEAVKEYEECSPKQTFAPHVIIGNNVSFGEYVHIGCNNKVIIGNNVLLGSKIYITDHNHGRYSGELQDSPYLFPKKRQLSTNNHVIIEDNVWIGENCAILPGVTIGYGTIIGSNSVVTHDVPAGCIAVGSPARIMKKYDEKKGIWANYEE